MHIILTVNTLSAQTFNWVYSAGGNSWDDVKSSHFGADKGTVITGMFSGTANFGSVTLTSLSFQDAFVAKYDEFGNVLWVKPISGSNEQEWGYDVTTDNANNVFVIGYFQSNSLKFTPTDSLIKNATSSRNGFLAKYNSNGVFQWAKSMTGGVTNGYITPNSVTTDNANNVIVAGQYNKQVFFDTTYLPNTISSNMFMAKYSSTGNLLWAKAGVSTAQCWFADLTCDASNNIYATGKISKKITFGTMSSAQVSGDQLIVAKFDNTGAPIWMQLQGDSLSASTSDNNFDCVITIKLDAANNIFVGGSILDTMYVLNGSLVVKQYATICKYNNTGTLQWSKMFGVDKADKIAAIDLDANGDVYAIGTYVNNFSVGGVVLPTDTNTTSFVAKFNSNNGNTIFAYRNGVCNSLSEGWGIGVNKLNGNVYTTGIYKGVTTFNNAITSAGVWDIYQFIK